MNDIAKHLYWCAVHGDQEEAIKAMEHGAEEIERLTRERDALRAALTPSAETKAAYIGEFKFAVGYCDDDHEIVAPWTTVKEIMGREIGVPWTTVKEIMKAVLARAALEAKP